MLYIGEQLGCEIGNPNVAAIDIAVDPLECTNNCAETYPIQLLFLQLLQEVLFCMLQIVTWIKLLQVLKWKVK